MKAIAALVLMVSWGSLSPASELRTILKSSAIGTGAGALVGLTALAFSDKPGENLSLITRGASLGLYAGLAAGIYLASQDQDQNSAQVFLYPSLQGEPSIGFLARF